MINLKLPPLFKTRKKLPRGAKAAINSASDAPSTRTQLLAFYRFYFYYAARNWMFWSLAAFLLLALILVPAVLFGVNGKDAALTHSLVIYAPFFATNIAIPALLSWLLFAKTQRDGTALFVRSQRLRRNYEFIVKMMVIGSLSSLFVLVGGVIILITKLATQVDSENVAAAFFLSLMAGLFEVGFFASVFALISIALPLIASIVAVTITTLLLIITPLITGLISFGQTNQLVWAPSSNQVNYASVYQIDQNQNVVDYRLAVFNQDDADANYQQNLSHKSSFNLAQPRDVGIFVDQFATAPLRAFLASTVSPNASTLERIANSGAWGLYPVNDQVVGDARMLQSDKTIPLVYSPLDSNPIQSSFDEVVQAWVSHLQNIPRTESYLNFANETSVQSWTRSLKSLSSVWQGNSFPENSKERNTLYYLLGLTPRSPLIFYLVRDYSALSAKYASFLTALENAKISAAQIELVEFLLTSPVVRANVFYGSKDASSPFPATEISKLYPTTRRENPNKRALAADIEAMHNLVNNIIVDPQQGRLVSVDIQISDASDAYRRVSAAGFPVAGEGVTSKEAWDIFVDTNNTLGLLKSNYDAINTWLVANNPNLRLRTITFGENDISPTNFSEVIDLNIATTSVATPIFMIVFTILGIAALSGSTVLNRRLLIK